MPSFAGITRSDEEGEGLGMLFSKIDSRVFCSYFIKA